jgi:ElaB/YqjD/DUF883 family membrane-anchored ribosome-binding protein
MAISAKRTIKRIEDGGDDLVDSLNAQIASLREELASISDSVSKYGNNHFKDVQHNALAVVDEVRHQGQVAARQITRQANVAGKAVQENPIPVIVALGTIALISALIFTATDR